MDHLASLASGNSHSPERSKVGVTNLEVTAKDQDGFDFDLWGEYTVAAEQMRDESREAVPDRAIRELR